jgi:ribonuclease Z
MLRLVYLGTGAAVPSPGRDNTCLALDDGQEITLIDASGSPLKRLADAGLPPERLTRVIITHRHLDHTFGLPSLLQGLWLTGRRAPLPVYAEPETWGFLDRLIDVFRPSSWTDAFEIERRPISLGETFLTTPTTSFRAGRGEHSVASVGLRVESGQTTLVYSSDTSPCQSIIELARDADLLIHESTFQAGAEAAALRLGHSTAGQAAQVATAAGARRLTLIHYTPETDGDLGRLRAGAAAVFGGPIDVPSDLATTTLD